MNTEQNLDLPYLRNLFGASTEPWAEQFFEHRETGFTALSGVGQPDYNLSLVHDGDVNTLVAASLEEIGRAHQPAIVMLAGPGLSGAQTLVDAGWVCVGAMPFMVRESPGGTPDPDVRELTVDDLDAARVLAGAAFGVGSTAAGRVFTPRILEHPNTTLAGLFHDGSMVSCGLMCRTDNASTGWAVATSPAHRGKGFARRLISGNLEIDFQRRGPTMNLCLATPSGRRMYEQIGFTVAEHWQTWSKPRWFLGGS